MYKMNVMPEMALSLIGQLTTLSQKVIGRALALGLIRQTITTFVLA